MSPTTMIKIGAFDPFLVINLVQLLAALKSDCNLSKLVTQHEKMG